MLQDRYEALKGSSFTSCLFPRLLHRDISDPRERKGARAAKPEGDGSRVQDGEDGESPDAGMEIKQNGDGGKPR